jgi:sigma-54 specific flagellar transcriptional regulator A
MSFEGAVLIIEGDRHSRECLHSIVEFMGFEPLCAAGTEDLASITSTATPWVALLGPSCVATATLESLQRVKRRYPELPVLLLVDKDARKSIHPDLARETDGWLDLPLRHAHLASALQDLYETSNTGATARVTHRSPELFRSLIGNSTSIARVRKLIEQVSGTDTNVLILGEPSTGKEVVARKLHYFSARRDKPFVSVNCSTISSGMLESELFGHEKGAFAGAVCARPGLFELAEGGTLFLDDIADMHLGVQAKFLRALRERAFERVGSSRSVRANVRIITATHRNLEQMSDQGKFRKDLLYRLNVFPIDMPALRDRREDVPLLIEELLRRLQHERHVTLKFTHAAIGALSAYRWPGNVTELSNLVERLAILHPGGVVDLGDLSDKLRGPTATPVPVGVVANDLPVHPLSLPRLPREGLDLKEHLNHLELTFIKQALEETSGVVARAAERLHLRRTTLVEKLRKYGLHRADDKVSNF